MCFGGRGLVLWGQGAGCALGAGGKGNDQQTLKGEAGPLLLICWDCFRDNIEETVEKLDEVCMSLHEHLCTILY